MPEKQAVNPRRLAIVPLGLNREEAADFVGVCPTTFDKMVAEGLMPKPKRIYRRKVWDREKVAAAFRRLEGDDDDAPSDDVAELLRT